MNAISFAEILSAVRGTAYINSNYYKYNNLSTDSRKIVKDSIFIALKGENFNGNNYVKQASENGASLCIVDEIKFKGEDLNKNTSIIVVDDTREALLDLAEYYRSKLDIKVIGITGSTGKTSTKDLVAAALGSQFKVFKTKGNFNNEIGLPLMIFQLDNSYDVAILEMGMSNLGEIHRLCKVARPDIGIITNIGISHIENLKTRENILKAKMEITDFFSKDCTLILNDENDLLKTISSKDYKIIRVGFEGNLDYKVEDIVLDENHIEFSVIEDKDRERFSVPALGRHNVLNSLLAIAAGRNLKVKFDKLKDGIKNLNATSMRLDIVKGSKFTIVDDCYNASPDSMRAALDVLYSIKGKRKLAILGTMKELGENSYEFHKEVGEYAKLKGLDLLIAIGEYKNAYKDGFKKDDNFLGFDNLDNACKYITDIIKKEDIILVKASRSMKFENIVNNLKDKNH